MKEFGTNLSNLFKVKTLITLPIIFALVYGFIIKLIEPKDFIVIAMVVITYYFNKKDEVDASTTTTETTSTTGTPTAIKEDTEV